MGSLSDWFVALTTTVLGACLGLMLTVWLAYSEIKQRADLKGDWLSISETGESREPVRDMVTIGIHRSRGKIVIRNRQKTGGFDYEARCSLADKCMLTGSWESLRPGALASGQLMLQISSQGSYLYGVYSGIRSDGHHMLLGWVLGRDEASLQAGILALRAGTSTSFDV